MSDLLNVIRAAASVQQASATGSLSSTTPDEAYDEAYDAAFAAETARIGAVLGATGIKGNAKRMQAALDLLGRSPGMNSQTAVGFITENIKEQQGSYAERRIGAAHARLGNGGDNPLVAQAVEKANRRRG